VLALGIPGAVSGADRHALIVCGAAGGEKYAAEYQKLRSTLLTALRDRLAFDAGRITVLSEAPGPDVASRENVRRVVGALRQQLGADDLLLIVLIGHGTFDGTSAKFNLVGPDMDAKEWKQSLDGLAARLIFVDTTGSSFPFLQELSGKRRIVITATDSPGQGYDTVFPQFFASAFDGLAADADKDGRVSLWEAFSHASQSVQRWFEQRGQLSTERAVIDDNGDGVGKEALGAGPDGSVARTVFLDPEPGAGGADAVLAGLQRRRQAVTEEIEGLKARKGSMKPDQYESELERLAVELARISRVIRERS